MKLSRFRINIIVQAVLLAFTSLLFAWAMQSDHLLVTSINLAAVWLLQLGFLIHYLGKVNRDLERFFSSFAWEEGTQLFNSSNSDKAFRRLHEQMNHVIRRWSEIRLSKERQQQLYQNALQQSATGLCIVDSRGTIIEANEAFHHMFNIKSLVRLDQLDQVQDQLSFKLLKLSPQHRELIQLNHSGKIFRLAVHSAIIKMDNQTYRLLSAEDVRNEMELAEIDAQQKMIRVITHEIMNSVSPINLMVSGLLERFHRQKGEPDKMLREKTIESLEVIQKRSRSLTRFVESYRSFNKIPDPILDVFQVKHITDHIKVLFSEELTQKNIKLEVEISPLDLTLHADEKMIQQVVINLVKNAIEAIEHNKIKILKIICIRTNEHISIEVRDNGTGIPAEIAGQIFVPYFTTKEEGSGIGLSFARQVIKLHNGQISFTSNEGKGSSFTLMIPF